MRTRRITTVAIDDVRNVYFNRMSGIRQPPDLLGGEGDFTGTVDSDGFAGAWSASRNASGNVQNGAGAYEHVQEVTSHDDYAGVKIGNFSLDPNTDYTIGGFLDQDTRVYLGDDGNSRIPGVDWFPNAQGNRFVFAQFSTGSSPTSDSGSSPATPGRSTWTAGI